MRYKLVLFFLCIALQATADILYENKHQRWELVEVVNTGSYTALRIDIHILSNRAGCFDAHLYDTRNASIYLAGDFGQYPLYKSVFEGDYKPWEQWSGYIEWNYYERWQKDKTAHATFYFARVPAGISSVHFHYYGGWANEAAECDKYECPKFDVYHLAIPDNGNTTRQTGWKESSLRQYWATHRCEKIEGIYQFVSASNSRWWGPVRHRLAVKKETDAYHVIYLDGANADVWQPGELKGSFGLTATEGVYKVEEWYIETKMLSAADFYIKYHERYLTLMDVRSGVEVLFMKLFPEEDIEDAWPTQGPFAQRR